MFHLVQCNTSKSNSGNFVTCNFKVQGSDSNFMRKVSTGGGGD